MLIYVTSKGVLSLDLVLPVLACMWVASAFVKPTIRVSFAVNGVNRTYLGSVAFLCACR